MAGLEALAGIKIPGQISRVSRICDLEQRKADIYNRTPGDLPGELCEKCRNKGYVMRIEDGYRITRECECMSARKSIAMMQKSGLGELLERCTFDAYLTQFQWQESAKRLAMDYANNPAGRWFVASGRSGSGKTHLCTAICGQLLKAGMETRYMLWVDESRRLKASVNDEEAYRRMIRPLKNVKVLYIDDMFKPRSETDWKTGERRRVTATAPDITLAYEILNSRIMRSDLITIISTELTMSDIMELDEALGSRIYQASKGSYIQMTGEKNWRMR